MIGYVMVIYDYDIPEYDIWHMMIDESMQGRGYGSQALDQVIAYIRTKPFGNSDRVALTCNKHNSAARKLYENKGFSVSGVEDEDEIELVVQLAKKRWKTRPIPSLFQFLLDIYFNFSNICAENPLSA